MKGTARYKDARGSSLATVIRGTSNKHTGRPLAILKNNDRGSVPVPKVTVQFAKPNVSDITLDVNLDRNDHPNQRTFLAYDQTRNVRLYGRHKCISI